MLLQLLKNKLIRREALPIPIEIINETSLTPTDSYWANHTVNSTPFSSKRESVKYLRWRFKEYPLFKELMELYGDHQNETVLDYGCGPGNDIVGFLLYSTARKVIGIDVSRKALELAASRLRLHRIDPGRVQLIETKDSSSVIPLVTESVDYVYCEGVLHHTSCPEGIIKEFHRILKPNANACIMVYNRNSLWFHLYTAYVRTVLENAFADLSIDEAFSRNTDGENCPLARCYRPEEFIAICEKQNFRTEFVGGYLALHELNLLKKYRTLALSDDRLAPEHRSFLRELTYDNKGYPMYKGKHAGIGGVYKLRRL